MDPAEPRRRTVDLPGPVSLRLVLGPHARGGGDPYLRFSRDGSAWRATRTPDGPATLRLVPEGEARIRVDAWGPGAAWVLEQAPALLGATDEPGDFASLVAGVPLLRDLARRFPALRIGRTDRVLEALVPAICEQKVTGTEARGAIVGIARRLGEPAPGPWDAARHAAPIRTPPTPDALAGLPGYAYHPLGLEGRRAEAIRFAAARAVRVEETTTMPLPDAYARLRAFPLVGAWTAAETGFRAFGDPDIVSTGDFHLPNTVAFALAGEERGTDDRMLELLAPFAGQRGRVIRLIEAAGIRAPRRGPRLAPRRITEM